jgi:formylglycine-generating enzyme required for sulfatase activity/serine/threonine protein kinase
MNQKANPSDPSLPVSELAEIDKICLQFEAEWQAGRQPEAADYLGTTPEPQRSELKRELEALEAAYRQRAKKPSLELFIQTLAKSGLMTSAEVQAFLASLPAEKRPADAETLAREMFKQGKLTRFQAQAVFQGKTRGLVVGNYVVLDKLGQGGMGQVYKARHKRMDRVVAIKMLPSTATRSPEAVERFHREVKAAAKLSHPNIVTAYDADEANGVNFLVMEHVDGQDLAALVKGQGPLSVAQAVDFAVQATKGLEYAHRQGVVHRDIKPSNLLLDKSGVVKILDMGLARMDNAAGTADDGLTQTGQVLGTLDYMAPDQALDTHHADARADIYGLGCTLYYLLTGRPPFAGETLTQKIIAHREYPIPSLRAARPDVPQWLDGVFQKMLAKRPEDRQQSMAEVAAQLQQQVLPETVPAAPLGPSRGNVEETLSLRQGPIETSSQQIEVPASGPPRTRTGKAAAAESPLSLSAREATGDASRQRISTGVKAKPWTRALLAWHRLARRRKIATASAVSLLFLVVLLGVILMLRTREGTLLVEIEDPNVIVQVLDSEGAVQIERPGEQDKVTIAVDPGKHRLRVQKDGMELFAKDFVIASGGRETIKARWEPPLPNRGTGPEPPRAVAPFDEKKAKGHQAAWAKHLGVPVELTNSIGMKLVLIPAGEFMMGSPKEIIDEESKAADDQWCKDRLPAEGPRHHVRITQPFYLGAYHVTQVEYQQVMGTNPSEFSATGKGKDKVAGQDTKRFPVECVSWDDAVEFCRKLSALPEEKAAGRWYRLPGEAQWEYACRAGTTGRFSFSPIGRAIPRDYDEHELPDHGWFDENSGGMPHTVGLKGANAWGLFDIQGSVWQWCRDCYDKDYYAGSPVDDPVVPSAGGDRVSRGGSWLRAAGYCRSAYRNHSGAGLRNLDLGFRVSLVLPDRAAERAKTGRTTDAAQPSAGSTADKPSLPVANPESQSSVRLPAVGSLVGADGKWNLPPGAPPPATAPFEAEKAKEHQAAWAKYLGVPVEITNSIGMKLVLIPPGEFEMGSPKELIEEELKAHAADGYWVERLPGEAPRHPVRLTKPFYLGACLVTQGEYEKVMGSNPSEFSATGKSKDKVAGRDTKRFPVECVSWDDCVEFCRKLSDMPAEKAAGRTYRLPSEAQWEYACHAGSVGRYGFSSGRSGVPWEYEDKALSGYGWFDANSGGMTHAVGGKPPSAWGSYDMHGNVWEWCQDWYDRGYYTNSPVDDPGGPPGGSYRVNRGGSWRDPAGYCRSAGRNSYEPGSRHMGLGFRACLVLPDK